MQCKHCAYPLNAGNSTVHLNCWLTIALSVNGQFQIASICTLENSSSVAPYISFDCLITSWLHYSGNVCVCEWWKIWSKSWLVLINTDNCKKSTCISVFTAPILPPFTCLNFLVVWSFILYSLLALSFVVYLLMLAIN